MHTIDKPSPSAPPSYTESVSNYIPNSAPPPYTPYISTISIQNPPANIPCDQSIIIAERVETNKSKCRKKSIQIFVRDPQSYV